MAAALSVFAHVTQYETGFVAGVFALGLLVGYAAGWMWNRRPIE